jgi:outer membrane lipoprotein
MRPWSLLALSVLAVGCMRPPRQLTGTFAPLTVAEAQARPRLDERVRWGGEIVSTSPGPGRTCFEVVSLPLDRQARPRLSDQTFGRFIACVPGFYDPAIHAPGREITVVGALAAPTTGKVGEYDYTFARVDAETVYLWPEREPVVYSPWVGPYWGPVWSVYWFGAPSCGPDRWYGH